MNQQDQQKQSITTEEINGRINEIERQRNSALSDSALKAGIIERQSVLIRKMNDQNIQLKQYFQDMEGPLTDFGDPQLETLKNRLRKRYNGIVAEQKKRQGDDEDTEVKAGLRVVKEGKDNTLE